jgi:hypothetical protein
MPFPKGKTQDVKKMKNIQYIQLLSTHLDLCDLFYATRFENYNPDTLDISALELDDENAEDGEVY